MVILHDAIKQFRMRFLCI